MGCTKEKNGCDLRVGRVQGVNVAEEFSVLSTMESHLMEGKWKKEAK